ncbi:MAG: hypothetical protein ACSHWU_02090 [Marinicella sp.]
MKFLFIRSLTIATTFCCAAFANDFTSIQPLSLRSGQIPITINQLQPITGNAHRNILFFEDFNNGIIPPNWVLDDVDGLTPDSHVGFFLQTLGFPLSMKVIG